MKFKRIGIAILSVFLLSTSLIFAAGKDSFFAFTGQLFYNNKQLSLTKEMYNINGSIYVPVRSFTESIHGHVSYDKSTQTIYVDQQVATNKKSVMNKKVSNDSFTLQVFSSQEAYNYGEAIEIWARLSNHTDQTITIGHGEALIDYTITDEDGFTSHLLHGYPIYYTTFNAGDEFNSNLNYNAFLWYNIDKEGLENIIDMPTFLNNTLRPALLPVGTYEVNVFVQYNNEHEEWETIELSIPLTIN